jgi:ketosteroid isomerase-like protein
MLASVIEGDKGAVRWRVRLRHAPTGENHETELFDLWTIEGDRVKSVVQFCDTALVAKLVSKS